MKHALAIVLLLQIASYAQNKRILVLWNTDGPAHTNFELNELWNHAKSQGLDLIPLDSSNMLSERYADSIQKNPEFLNNFALKKLQVSGILRLQWSQVESQAQRYLWFPLISKFQYQQKLNFSYRGANSTTAMTIISQQKVWGSWCGFKKCTIPLQSPELQRQIQKNLEFNLIDSCAKKLP